MNFSSIPAYNLEPSNWQQQQNYQLLGNNGTNTSLPTAQQSGLPPPPPHQPHGGGGAGSIRPGSMSERARLANLPIPETALKCPRCDSTNTKFCYFNNYSLTQPRHFCKTCRRYWTKNGTLRSVPVGGGCRRNKRSKSTSSKSPLRNEKQTTSASTSTVSVPNSLGLTQQFPPGLRFMAPNLLSQLTSNFATDVGMGGYSGSSAPMVGTSEMNFHGTNPNLFGMEPWRLQQFPFLDGSDPSLPGINYHFQGGESGVRPPTSMLTQMGLVKEELENAELNRVRQFLGPGNDDERSNHNIVTSAWSELSNF